MIAWLNATLNLFTGEINLPYAWQPAIVEISILRAGQLVILAVPGELTTMAGRRLRKAVHDLVLFLIAHLSYAANSNFCSSCI